MSTEIADGVSTDAWFTAYPSHVVRRPAWRLSRGTCDVCKDPTHAQHIPTGRHVHLVCWATEREEEAQRADADWLTEERAMETGRDRCPACFRWSVDVTETGVICRATDCGAHP